MMPKVPTLMTMMLINMWYIILVSKQKLELGRCRDQND